MRSKSDTLLQSCCRRGLFARSLLSRPEADYNRESDVHELGLTGHDQALLMLRIQANSYNDQPITQPLSAEFDEMGGSIGRSEGNTLMLPDEKRYISRTQASIGFRNGSYVLRDHGSATPSIVNDSPVGNGNEIALREGDVLRIGDYVLTVSTGSAAVGSMADPFADLLPPSQPAPTARSPASNAAKLPADPFDDPFAFPASAPASASSSAPASGVIPHDYDPFADLMPNPPPVSPPASDGLGLSGGSNQTVDDLFGLKAPDTWDPLGPGSPLKAPDSFELGGAGADPFADLMPASSRPPQAVPPQRDDSPILSGAFKPPQPRQAQAIPRTVPVPRKPAPSAPDRKSDGIVLSWDTPSAPAADGEIKTVILASPKRTPSPLAAEPAPRMSAPAQSPPTPSPMQSGPSAFDAGRSGAPVSPSAPAQAPTAGSRDALLAAFAEGAGMAELPGGLTPEFMKLLGQLLRESISGTLELLLARALTKREVRAQATVIVARENNPLKFSPNVDAALSNLLVPQGHGYMSPTNAMRDAYNDLRSHQFGLMAGMRAALEGVLLRFDPAQLEQRLAQKGRLSSILPSNRRAKLWELYEQLYRDISREAEDDFQTLFGKAFLRAYEAQIEKLEQEDAADKR